VLIGGGAADEAELMAPIERGLYVTRLWYLNVVHQKSTQVTGTTRDGTFLIEDGRIGRPLRDVRFTDSILRLLEATEALTATQRLVSEADFYGRRFASGVVTPGAARAGPQDHRADGVSASARHMAASAATGSGANWAPTRRSHSASASSRERAAE
jgi:predicted Zn-dependent protease